MKSEDQLSIPHEILDSIRKRYSIEESYFKTLQFFRLNKSFVHVLPPETDIPKELKIHTLGIPFVKLSLKTPKLTTQGAQLLSNYASKNIIEVSEKELINYLQRIPVKYLSQQNIDDGYILVAFEKAIIGTGVWKSETNTLLSQWPKQLSFIKD